jgi:hypothetical protein
LRDLAADRYPVVGKTDVSAVSRAGRQQDGHQQRRRDDKHDPSAARLHGTPPNCASVQGAVISVLT